MKNANNFKESLNDARAICVVYVYTYTYCLLITFVWLMSPLKKIFCDMAHIKVQTHTHTFIGVRMNNLITNACAY